MQARMAAMLGWIALAGIAGLVAASSADAAGSPFSCAANAVEASLPNQATYDPTAVNGAPCVNQQRVSSQPQSSGPLHVGPTAAYGHTQRRRQAAGAGAFASAAGAEVRSSKHDVVIEEAEAEASLGCVAGAPTPSSTSFVSGIRIDGKPVTLANPDQADRISFGGDGSYLLVNQTDLSGGTLTRTAAFLHLPGTGDFTFAQALVTQSARPCAATRGFPGRVQACPTGSAYDPGTQQCTITSSTKHPIRVAAPYRGPIGGSVYSLARARSVVKGHNCLRGSGLPYVLVAAPSGGGLVEGTNGPDRIIGVGGSYKILGEGGADCISVGGGHADIKDGNGKLRVYGSSGGATVTVGNGDDQINLGAGTNIIRAGGGNDVVTTGPGVSRIRLGGGSDRVTLSLGFSTVTAGNGNDYVHAGPGHASITLGNGSDTVYGGAGLDEINVGNGRDSVFAGVGISLITAGTGQDVIRSGIGFSRITARGAGAQVTCRDHAHVVVPAGAVAFARSHGCKTVSAG